VLTVILYPGSSLNHSDTFALFTRMYTNTGTPKNIKAKTNETMTGYAINNQPNIMTPVNNQINIITAFGISSGTIDSSH